jgi:hypothetical protein
MHLANVGLTTHVRISDDYCLLEKQEVQLNLMSHAWQICPDLVVTV